MFHFISSGNPLTLRLAAVVKNKSQGYNHLAAQ